MTNMTRKEKRMKEYEEDVRETYKLLVDHNLDNRPPEDIEADIQEQILQELKTIEWEEKEIKFTNSIMGTNHEVEGGYEKISKETRLEYCLRKMKEEVEGIKFFQKVRGNFDKEWYDKMLKAMLQVVKYYKEEIEKITN